MGHASKSSAANVVHGQDATPWHAMAPVDAVAALDTHEERGLDPQEVGLRLERDGPNTITPPRGRPWWLRLLLQFHAPLIYILLAATLATLLLGEYLDGAVIFGVVLANAAIGFVEESRAVKAIDALARSMRLEATVLRGAARHRIDAAGLVRGDVVLLEAGDRIPADLRLLAVHDLQCDESALTGESRPVGKRPDALPADVVLADRACMAYAGSLVTRGWGKGLVVSTGDATEVGRISEMIASAENLSTPLNRRIAAFSRLLLLVILGVAALTFVVGLLRGFGAVEMFMASVALAVAAIPEGLPAAVTIMLAVGVGRMAQRRAIIRRLPAVEALGSTTVICSDKTGTLTQNEMTVQAAWVLGSDGVDGLRFEFTGTGYDPHGRILAPGSGAESAPPAEGIPAPVALLELLRCGALCNEAQLVPPESSREGRWSMQGDPTEAALLVAYRKLVAASDDRFDADDPRRVVVAADADAPSVLHQRWPRRATIPFDSDHQDMATLHGRPEDDGMPGPVGEPRPAGSIYWKGSVEKLLEKATRALTADGREVPLDRATVLAASERLAAGGLRVLAFARRLVDRESLDRGLHRGDVDGGGLVFLGLQGMLDPARPEAIEAVRDCRRAGIQVKMITGDHAATAVSIARTVGLEVPESDSDATPDAREEPDPAPSALTGAEMAGIPDARLPALAERVAVFARMTPEQKLRLVKALQSRGHIVAMTGDGVNDAPALRQADIGVAMGMSGTEAAKDAADMVLADDNFASIRAAVEEGRTVFANLTKFLVWTLPTNGAQATVILASVMLGWTLPILPIHALYVNMFTALLLGMPLIFERREPQVMERPPRDPAKPLFTRGMIMRTGFVSLLLGGGVMAVFNHEIRLGTSEEVARTAGVTVLVLGQACYLFSARALLRPAWTVPLGSNPWLWAGIAAMLLVQLAFVHLAAANRLFATAPISLGMWAWAAGAGFILLILVETEKAIRRAVGSDPDV